MGLQGLILSTQAIALGKVKNLDSVENMIAMNHKKHVFATVDPS